LKQEIERRCRLCKEHEETIDNLTSGYPTLAKNEWITQACEDFAATIIIGEMGYTKCRDSKNVNGFYVSRTDI
jgi:hypothetical protein